LTWTIAEVRRTKDTSTKVSCEGSGERRMPGGASGFG
jgi:hypothetical protein